MFKEESGILMLFGADWEAVVTADYDEEGPAITRIELQGYYDRGVLIKFEVPAVVDLRSVPHSEFEGMVEWFETYEPDDDYSDDDNRWVKLP
jgi:hypothetical protein